MIATFLRIVLATVVTLYVIALPFIWQESMDKEDVFFLSAWVMGIAATLAIVAQGFVLLWVWALQ